MCTRIHKAEHSDIICIETQSYILDVSDKNIKSSHCLFGWAMALAIVEGENRYPRLLINATCYMFALACSSAEAMFWREDSRNLYPMFE